MTPRPGVAGVIAMAGVADQYLTVQPTLGGDGGRFHGELLGVWFATFDEALTERATIGSLPDGTRLSRRHRNAHAPGSSDHRVFGLHP
ncbi:MAG: hypothetical protein EHM57_06645, partial [Actinobacteria bacterium]